MLSSEVLAHFGLRRDPFRGEIAEGGDLFLYAAFRRAEGMVLEAARRKEFAAVIGPIGVGKTLLRKRAGEALRRDPRVRLLEPKGLANEVIALRSIEEGLILELSPSGTVPSSVERRARRLAELLDAAAAEEKIVCAFLDEAHAYPTRTLRTFKRIIEMSGFERRCGVILFGQIELSRALGDPTLREVGARCRTIPLEGLARREVAEYLDWKVSRARSGREGRALFDAGAIEAMARANRREGIDRLRDAARIPLVLGNLASRALEIAFAAAAERVSAEHVEAVFAG